MPAGANNPDRWRSTPNTWDIIYVLQGSATVITGGEANPDAKTIAPDELRGSSIRDGETRHIAKGDVVIVPHGAPHQFVQVTNPFDHARGVHKEKTPVKNQLNHDWRLTATAALLTAIISLIALKAEGQSIQDPPFGRPDVVVHLASRGRRRSRPGPVASTMTSRSWMPIPARLAPI